MSGTIDEKKPTGEECQDDNCNDHDHDHDHDGEGGAHKASKGEKKFKKAIGKMGMKPVDGIERVTLRTQKDFIMYIDNPEVVTTGAVGSYIIFGEVKFLDFSNPGAQHMEKMKDAQAARKEKPAETITEEDEGDEEEGAGDIPEESIKTLMEYANCTRAKAIKCLKKTNGDVVEAITLAS